MSSFLGDIKSLIRLHLYLGHVLHSAIRGMEPQLVIAEKPYSGREVCFKINTYNVHVYVKVKSISSRGILHCIQQNLCMTVYMYQNISSFHQCEARNMSKKYHVVKIAITGTLLKTIKVEAFTIHTAVAV